MAAAEDVCGVLSKPSVGGADTAGGPGGKFLCLGGLIVKAGGLARAWSRWGDRGRRLQCSKLLEVQTPQVER